MELVVTSRAAIKPSRPTPQHLRHLPLSFLDRITHRVFIPMVYFYSGGGSGKGEIVKATNLLETSNHLKASLPEALVKFYPLAGRVKEYHTECNDEGVPYFEAQAKFQMSQVIGDPCLAKLNNLLPCDEHARDLPLAIQVNFFDCGGFAIGACFSHKVLDATSWSSFMNYWAAVARSGDTNLICSGGPTFDMAKLFPPLEKQISNGNTNCSSSVGRRFVFTGSALSAMRSKYAMPMVSRGEAISAFMWARILAASPKRRWLAYHVVDLRKRMDPALSEYHIGNLAAFVGSGSSMEEEEDNSVFIKKTRDAITRLDDKFAKNLHKAEHARRYLRSLKVERGITPLYFTNLIKLPLFEADFGWGRPIRMSGSGLYTLNTLVFMPGRSGDGAEVLVFLKGEDMAKLEADKQLLEFVSPPPLGFENQIISSL